MYIEIEQKEALARSMMLALANDKGLPNDATEAVQVLWTYYRLALGDLDILEHDWNMNLNEHLQLIRKQATQEPERGTAKE